MHHPKKYWTHTIAALRHATRHTTSRVLLLVACATVSLAASAQDYPPFPAYPTFNAGGETQLRTDASPALSYLQNGNAVIAYRDSETGTLQVSTSADGITWSSPVDTGVRTDGSIGVTNLGYPDYKLYFLVHAEGRFQYMTSLDGINFTPPRPIALSNNGRKPIDSVHPGLTFYNHQIYISLAETTPGHPATIDVLASDDGESFTSIQWFSDTPATSGSTLSPYTPYGTSQQEIALAYTTGRDNHVIAREYLYGDTTWYSTDSPILMAGTPQIVDAGTGFDLFGRSTGDEHRLIATFSWDSTTFAPIHGYDLFPKHAPAIGSAGKNFVVALQSREGHKIETHVDVYTPTTSP